MANKSLFQTITGKFLPATDAVNEAGGVAYTATPRHALAQYAATGCLNATYYASAEDQLAKVLQWCAQVDPRFIAKTALFCREKGFMKDMPALLCAALSTRDTALMAQVFSRVCNNAKMVRNFVQIMRSGAVGRKSLGSAAKACVQQWLAAQSDEALFCAAVGQSPSLPDIIKMVHPKATTASRNALYAYWTNSGYDSNALPEIVKTYEVCKTGVWSELPDIPFQLLTSLPLTRNDWVQIARHASWQTTRMNLNTFARHGVFEDKGLTTLIAGRLRSPELVKRARVFPYQLLSAYLAADSSVPNGVRDALQDAMEIALENVPALDGEIHICVDVSGSMQSAVTGVRKGATSKVRCIDVAALVAAALMRKNRDAQVHPFEVNVVPIRLNPRDSVMTNATKLAAVGGGGANCSAPLAALNRQKATGDLVIYVSDNESWVDSNGNGRGTATMREWTRFKTRNSRAKLVCIDLQPVATLQAAEREDILNIGGFSDVVFELLANFAKNGLNAVHWVDVIEKTEI